MADARKPSPRSGSSAREKGKASTVKKPRKEPMAESESESVTGNVFDVERIRRLVELMKEHDLNEIDLRESRHRIRIQRGVAMQYAAAPIMAAPAPAPAAQPAAAPASGGGAKSVAMDGPNITLIKSPMVGTFYSRANPKSNPFVKVGDRVDTNTTVCIVEAMKVFNEIPAEVRGTIVAVLVEDGEAVEFDKPLFKIDTSK